MKPHTMIVGTSEPQDFQLFDDGAELDGTGWDVGIEFREDDTELAGLTVAWLDQDAGTVRVTGCEAMAEGIYHFRFTLTDADEKVGYVPNLEAAGTWHVRGL